MKISILNFGKSVMHFIKLSNILDFIKRVRIWSYSGPHFPAFGLNTERYGVSLRVQSKCGKIRTRVTANVDTFYVVLNSCQSPIYICKHLTYLKEKQSSNWRVSKAWPNNVFGKYSAINRRFIDAVKMFSQYTFPEFIFCGLQISRKRGYS